MQTAAHTVCNTQTTDVQRVETITKTKLEYAYRIVPPPHEKQHTHRWIFLVVVILSGKYTRRRGISITPRGLLRLTSLPLHCHSVIRRDVVVPHDDDDDDDEALAVVTSRLEVCRMFVPVHQTSRCRRPVSCTASDTITNCFHGSCIVTGAGVGGIAGGLICLLNEGSEENCDKSQSAEIRVA